MKNHPPRFLCYERQSINVKFSIIPHPYKEMCTVTIQNIEDLDILGCLLLNTQR